MKKTLLISILLVYGVALANAQISAWVKGVNSEGDTLVLPNANIYWSGSLQGTVSDLNGYFSIDTPPEGEVLITSYIGYKNDTISPPYKTQVYYIILKELNILNEVKITANGSNTHIDRLNPIWTQNITDGETCCLLQLSRKF